MWAKVCALGALCARIGEQKCAKAGAKVRSGEGALYRNGSEAVEDGGGFVDKRSGSVEEMELFGRGEWGGSVEGNGAVS